MNVLLVTIVFVGGSVYKTPNSAYIDIDSIIERVCSFCVLNRS